MSSNSVDLYALYQWWACSTKPVAREGSRFCLMGWSAEPRSQTEHHVLQPFRQLAIVKTLIYSNTLQPDPRRARTSPPLEHRAGYPLQPTPCRRPPGHRRHPHHGDGRGERSCQGRLPTPCTHATPLGGVCTCRRLEGRTSH